MDHGLYIAVGLISQAAPADSQRKGPKPKQNIGGMEILLMVEILPALCRHIYIYTIFGFGHVLGGFQNNPQPDPQPQSTPFLYENTCSQYYENNRNPKNESPNSLPADSQGIRPLPGRHPLERRRQEKRLESLLKAGIGLRKLAQNHPKSATTPYWQALGKQPIQQCGPC